MASSPSVSSGTTNRWCRYAMLVAMASTALVWAGFVPGLSETAWQLDTTLRDRLSLMLTPAKEREDLVFIGLQAESRMQPGIPPSVRTRSRALTLLHQSTGNETLDRRVCVDLINRLVGAGVRQIIFDILFIGSSGNPEIDLEFARALKKNGAQIILAELLNPREDGGYDLIRSVDQLPGLERAPGQMPQSAYVNLWPDAGDGVQRHMVYQTTISRLTGEPPRQDEPVYRSLAAAAALNMQERFSVGPNPRLRFAAPMGPPDTEAVASVSSAYAAHGIHRLFDPEVWRSAYDNGEFFRDKTVLLSTATIGDEDRHVIPGATIYGGQVHLHALGSLLDGAFWTEPPRWLELVALILMAAVGAMLVLAFHHPFTQALSCVALAGGFLVACIVLSEYTGFLFAGTPGVIGLLAVSFTGLTIKLFSRRPGAR